MVFDESNNLMTVAVAVAGTRTTDNDAFTRFVVELKCQQRTP